MLSSNLLLVYDQIKQEYKSTPTNHSSLIVGSFLFDKIFSEPSSRSQSVLVDHSNRRSPNQPLLICISFIQSRVAVVIRFVVSLQQKRSKNQTGITLLISSLSLSSSSFFFLLSSLFVISS